MLLADDLGPAVRNQIDTAFSENDELSRMFSVIEREKLDLVMKEQGLGAAGALDPQSAAKVGRILGVKYIVTGASSWRSRRHRANPSRPSRRVQAPASLGWSGMDAIGFP